MTICADLTGNIGNNLWQYSVTRTVAEHSGFEFGFNRHPSNDYFHGKEQMDFMEIDYGKEHDAPWCRDLSNPPPGINKIWCEPREYRNTDGHEYTYFPYTPEIFNVQDNTKLIIDCCQNFKYIEERKEDIRNWFKIKPECADKFAQTIHFYDGLELDENVCIINVRGGEYVGVKDFNLPVTYWNNAIKQMLSRNRKMKFIVVTEDIGYAKSILPYPVVHFGISIDYYMVNQAKNLIISNSSFAQFPTWLNPHNPFVIAPLYWGRYNVSTGYWSACEMNRPDWNFMDRGGNLHKV